MSAVDRVKAAAAFDVRLKRGWTPRDVTKERWWFFPSERRLWQERCAWDPTANPADDRAVLAQHEDAIHLMESGCLKCHVGYADVMSDPMFHCDLCDGTGFPVFGAAP